MLSDEVISPDTPPDAKDVFRLFVEGASEYAMFALSPTGVISTWNRGAERIKGYRAEEAIGKHFSIFYTERDRAAGVPERILEAALSGRGTAMEGWRIRKDGSQFWANVIVTPLYDATGRLQGFGKLTRDETERRENDEHAARYEERERIAMTLADTVLRQVFAMSLHADAALKLTSHAGAKQRLQSLVEEADEAIRYLRNTIYEIRGAEERPETP